MQTVHILCLLPLIIPNNCVAVTFQLEAESVSGKHKIRDRSQASQFLTVYVTYTTERLSFPFCLDRDLSDANISVTYSNDGGEDVVRVDVDNPQTLTFNSVAGSNWGQNWNVFRSASFQNVALSRGYHMLTLVFESLDTYGIEIDYVNVSVNNDFLTEDVFRCRLVLGEEPQFSPVSGVSAGYMRQYSYPTTCPEEDNVHLPVFHPSVQQYTLTATNPLYRTWYDFKTNDDRNCPFLDPVLWRFEDVALSVSGDMWQPTAPVPNHNDAKVVGVLLGPASSQSANNVVYRVMYKVTFDLKGFREGFIDADIYTDMKAVFCRDVSSSSSPTPSVSMSYVNREEQEVTLDTFDLPAQRVTKTWALKEMTWSEDHRNTLTVYITEADVTLCTLELIRGYMAPDTAVQIYSSDAVKLEGVRNSFWWRRPVRENLTVTVGDKTFRDLSRVALYVPAPWTGEKSFHQVMVLYQDGNVRLVPQPASSPNDRWTPFGTSVIVGRSQPTDFRPAASIQSMTFYPNTLQMALTYYDGSSCTLTLTYSMFETKLRVTDLHFKASTTTTTTSTSSDLPFATFRSMFVAFGNTDSDSVQSDHEGPEHVLGTWEKLEGREFLVYRAVESHHLTQSPDLRLTIEA